MNIQIRIPIRKSNVRHVSTRKMSNRYYDELPGHRTQRYGMQTLRHRAVSNYVDNKYQQQYNLEERKRQAEYLARMRKIDPYFAGGKPWKEIPSFKKTDFAYDDMIRNEALLKDKQEKLKALTLEVKSKRDAVVAARLIHVNKGFRKLDGGPIRNQTLFTGKMNVNKGFIAPGTVISFETNGECSILNK